MGFRHKVHLNKIMHYHEPTSTNIGFFLNLDKSMGEVTFYAPFQENKSLYNSGQLHLLLVSYLTAR
jgi:hypothetical protein